MEIYISIDGVLRNTIQKFDYHYNESYLADDVELEEDNTSELQHYILHKCKNNFKFETPMLGDLITGKKLLFFDSCNDIQYEYVIDFENQIAGP